MSSFILASYTLLRREIVRFLRQRNRIVGALGTPILFWFLIGSGLGKSFQSPSALGMNYLSYFFPGSVALILLFTAIFSTISIIEDRREGFLQGVLVSPASRGAIVMGKILGGTCLATAQGLFFIALAPLLPIPLHFTQVLYLVALMFVLSFGLTGLGFLIAWRMDSTQGFHAIMNLFLMPMWFLSGALFPASGAPAWLRFVMALNPLTYGVAGLHAGFFSWGTAGTTGINLTISLVFSGLMFVLAWINALKN
jgi:ABC-2 type transport system permease protein